MTKTFPITGMHCASCAVNIQRVLKKLPGVATATVNFATEKAQVEYDPEQVDEGKINEVIRPLGYAIAGEKKIDEVARWKWKFIVGGQHLGEFYRDELEYTSGFGINIAIWSGVGLL
ncbi:heavy-metal-associated domain-containing protein [Candidatus Amesbacteria bacterium]|nr:heavy-metal-associated domain-containing protein [Candidatus Amesbacteria bacterium]